MTHSYLGPALMLAGAACLLTANVMRAVDQRPEVFRLDAANVAEMEDACDERGFEALEIVRRGPFQQIKGKCIAGNNVVIVANPRETIIDPEAPYEPRPGELGGPR